MERIEVKLWFGGTIKVGFAKAKYVGGSSKLLDIHIDQMSYFELVDYAMETGCYKSRDFQVYCLNPDDGSLKQLVNDKDVLDMAMKFNNGSISFIKFLEVFIQDGPIVQAQPKPQAQPTNQQTQPGSPQQSMSSGSRLTKLSARRAPIQSQPTSAPAKIHIKSPLKPQSKTTVVPRSIKKKLSVSDKEDAVEDLDENSEYSDEEGTNEVIGSDKEDEVQEEVIGSLSDREDEEWRESV